MLLNFEKLAVENVTIYLTRQQSVTKLRQQIKDGRIRRKERKKNKVLVKFLNDNIYTFYRKTDILHCKMYFKI